MEKTWRCSSSFNRVALILSVLIFCLVPAKQPVHSKSRSALNQTGSNLSGRWSGTAEVQGNDGSSRSEPFYLILRSSGNSLSGSAGPSEVVQNPSLKGIVEEGRVRFELNRTTVSLQFDLQLEGNELHGTVRSSADPARPILFRAKRVGDLTLEDYHPRLTFEDGERSQEILRFREELRIGRPHAIEEFWQRLSKTETPIIEPIPGKDESFLVTFVWRGSEITKNVLLDRGRFTWAWPHRHLLSNIPGTNVWFKTLKFPRGLRATYAFSENDRLGALPQGTEPRKTQRDPLNTRQLEGRSILELPGAAPQPWYVKRPEVPKLTLTKLKLNSELLGDEREILAYTPPGYNRNRAEPYPTVYLFDGNDQDGEVFASQTIENLIHERKIPPVIVIRIVNLPGRRYDDLACNEKFSRFLAKELVPFVRSKYHVSPLASRTVIGGKSIGGLAAACAGMHAPNEFGLLLVQSGSFWWQPLQQDWAEPNWVARQFATIPKLPLTLYMEAGVWEVDLDGNGGNIIETSRHLRDVLIAKGYSLTYREFVGDHDRINWRGGLADGLIALLGPLIH